MFKIWKQYWSQWLALLLGIFVSTFLIGFFEINLCQSFNNCSDAVNLQGSQKKIQDLTDKVKSSNVLAQIKLKETRLLLQARQELTVEINKTIKESNDIMQSLTNESDKILKKLDLLEKILEVLSTYIHHH